MGPWMKKAVTGLILLSLAASLTGCGEKGKEPEYIALKKTVYAKDYYEGALIERGTLSPKIVLTLKPDDYLVTHYFIQKDTLKVSELLVEEGDFVKKGQVMVRFENEDAGDELKKYEKRAEEDRLLLEHYYKKQTINPKADYSVEIHNLEQDLVIVDAYVAEIKAKLSDYQIRCEEDGVVTGISSEIRKGYGVKKARLITVVSGSADYVATTGADYPFFVGQEVEAYLGVAPVTFRIKSIEEGGGSRQIKFSPVGDTPMSVTDGAIRLEIELEKRENVLYVDESAVSRLNGKTYVFLLDENGFRHPKEVSVGEVIDKKIILTDGVKEGEKVALR